ncbi:MAG: aldolase catalytic domain-containing protein [Candidatus Neomarinimicrobiota bacterium]
MKTKILDCTIRDGGYLNNWDFSRELVKDTYRSVSKTGVDYIEIGFRSTAKYFDPARVGLWRFTPENLVNDIVSNVAGAPLALMVDYGKADIEDIPPAAESPVRLYRIASHKTRLVEAIDFANQVAAKGYETAIQLMGIVGYTAADFQQILTPLKESQLTYVYFADSYGSLLPQDIYKYCDILRAVDKPLGFHPHNNMQLAFSNSLAAIAAEIDIVDGTVFGMGRGAGNLPLETLIAYFQKTIDENRYNMLPVLDLIQRWYLELKARFSWGYNLPYMISGVYEVHPNYAKALTDSGEFTIDEIQSVLQLIQCMNPVGFDKNIVPQIVQTGFVGRQSDTGHAEEDDRAPVIPIKPDYTDRYQGSDFLILANGSSLATCRMDIQRFIEQYQPVVIGSNYLGDLFVPHYHSFNNRRLFEQHVTSVHPDSGLLLCNGFEYDYIRRHTDRSYELIQHGAGPMAEFSLTDGIIGGDYRAIPILSIAAALAMGARRVFIAGMDGYKDFETFFNAGLGDSADDVNAGDKAGISSRSGTYREQMEWHNYVEASLKQINDYLVANEMNDLIIITPTTHRLYYESITNFISVGPQV